MNLRNEELISTLLVENYNKYYRIAFHYVKNETDAEDVVQEAAYKAILNSEKLHSTEYIDSWLCRIVINEAFTLLRHKKRFSDEPLEELAAPEQDFEHIDLEEALNRLPPKEKTVILLRYFEDMTLQQVAFACGESLSATKSRLYRTLQKLKLSLKDN